MGAGERRVERRPASVRARVPAQRREVVAETAFVCVNSMRIIERNSPLLDATRRDARDGRLVGGRLFGGGSRATTKRTARVVVVVVRVVVVHVVDDDDDERGDEIER